MVVRPGVGCGIRTRLGRGLVRVRDSITDAAVSGVVGVEGPSRTNISEGLPRLEARDERCCAEVVCLGNERCTETVSTLSQ